MAAGRIQLQNALHKPYDRVLFSREVLSQVFGSGFTLNASLVPAPVTPNQSESVAIDKVWMYGNIRLDDSTEVTCYEILLQPKVRIEHSKVATQQYVRKLLTAGQAALINFVAPANTNVWRLTLVAKDSVITDKGVKEKATNARRYTFLLGPSETCKTAAERFEALSIEKEITFQTLVNAFSVEKLSKAFFDEYTLHYRNFCDYLQESNYRISVFNISFPANATKQEKDKAGKPIRDFVKKMLGRIVFLYFVQKKGWLGANDTNYTDGPGNFIKKLFKDSGGNDAFYSNWLTPLFFDTLNSERPNDNFLIPNGKKVKVPFLNGGLFDKEEFDEHLLTFPSELFHLPDFEDEILTEKNNGLARGFLDFLDAFNFTVYEDSPDDRTVAVDPEILGHIFENLLEDNKDKGAFYTPKEIVHYMCQESLTEYLCTRLQIKNEAAEREAVNNLLKNKVFDDILKPEITELEKALDNVKICDPAIGSGAFPMGLLQEIFSIKELIAFETGKEWKPAETKLNIIQSSIYGVDIEKGAVDIARLRFWLSLVVNEEKPKPLPNLDYKIVVGDSLISKFEGEIVEIDWEIKTATQTDMFGNENLQKHKQLLLALTEKQRKYFDPKSKNKKALAFEIRNFKIDVLINQLELMVKTEGLEQPPVKTNFKDNKKYVVAQQRYQQTQSWQHTIAKLEKLKQNPAGPFNHFDWKLDFPEVLNPYLVNGNGGFDIVIANPPYVKARDSKEKEIRRKIEEKYQTTYKMWDLYVPFLEKALKMLNKKGNVTMIIPDTIGRADYTTKIVAMIENNFQLYRIDFFPESKIFENAAVKNKILFISQNLQERNPIRIIRGKSFYDYKILPDLQGIEKYHYEKNEIDIDTFNTEYLSDICFVSYGLRLNSDKDDKTFKFKKDDLLSDVKTKIHSMKYTEGKYIEKYKIVKSLFLEWNTDRCPARLVRPTFPELYVPQKLLLSRQKRIGAFSSEGHICDNTIILAILAKDLKKVENNNIKKYYSNLSINRKQVETNSSNYELKYLLSLINSTAIQYFIHGASKSSIDFYPDDWKKITIKKLSLKNQLPFVILADCILYLKTQNLLASVAQFMPTYFEQILDGMVYELYFPELIKKHNREIIKHLGELPEFTEGMSDEQKMKICKKVYQRLNDKEQPVRINLFNMSSIPEIAIIEGKNENN